LTRKQQDKIGEVIAEFVEQVESLATSLPLAMVVIQGAHRASYKSYEEFIKKNCTEETREGEHYVGIPIEHQDRYNALKKRVRRTYMAHSVVPRSFLVSLISSYDAFLGKLVSSLFQAKPEMLKSSERTLTYSQLSDFASIAEARDHLLEKEVETLLRKSHAEQFDWLESKFAIKLRVDLAVWPTFMEVTERRNLFVHSDGIVSSQYLKVCQEHGCGIDFEAEPGEQLEVSPDYFRSAYEAVFEIGVKLGQVLWRKLKSSDIKAADEKLSTVCYDLLTERKHRLAQKLLDFACSAPMKHSDEKYRLIFLVNRAQAYKWDGNSEKALEIIAGQDWSATEAAFQLAAAVLRDQHDVAIGLMEAIGASGNPSKTAYKTWPLFREIRKTKEFTDMFEKIFGEPFERTPVEKTLALPERNSDEDDSNETPPTVQ
jgi:hypothetical protein